jgi:hypothetical protein
VAFSAGAVFSAAQIFFINGFIMKRQSTPPEDDYEIRCPRLGHQISFSYCRSENKHFLVEDYFRKELAPEEWDKAFKRSTKTKTVSLVELIEQAKKAKEEGS